MILTRLVRYRATRSTIHRTGALPILRFFSSQSQVIQKLLQTEAFKKLEPTKDLATLQPYELTLKVNERLSKSSNGMLSINTRAKIYNSLIENLTKYDYSVSSISMVKLESMNQSPTLNAFMEMVKYNPGRKLPTWEMLKENLGLFDKNGDKSVRDKATLVVLLKLLALDPIEIEEGKTLTDSKDLTRIVFLLNNMSDELVLQIEKSVLDKIYEYMLATSSTILLTPFLNKVLKRSDYNMHVIPNEHLSTDLQKAITNIYKVKKDTNDQKAIHELIELANKHGKSNGIIAPFVTEEKPAEAIMAEVQRVNKLCLTSSFSVQLEVSETLSLSEAVEEMFAKMDFTKDVQLLKLMMRNIGTVKGDLQRCMELYHTYLRHHEDKMEFLQFEGFLSFAIKAYETNNFKLFEQSLFLLPQRSNDLDLSNKVVRALILLNSKFDIEKSLELFNSNIERFKETVHGREQDGSVDKKDAKGGLSLAGMLTECLMLAHLSQKDRDFAHVIFEGAAREKIINGPTSIKQIKSLLAFYGEILELPEKEFEKAMSEKVLSYLKSI
ncbi:hypothetical protein ACO0RG_000739 [Hanseniaspora osmophila]